MFSLIETELGAHAAVELIQEQPERVTFSVYLPGNGQCGTLMLTSAGVSSVATKKNVIPTTPQAKMPSPTEKLSIKTKSKDNDWYDAAFNRYSISLSRANQQRDMLSALRPPVKSQLQ